MENEVNDTPVLVETKEKRNQTDVVISLGGANQVNKNKNPIMENNIDDVMENEVNDTPVKVETKSEVRKVNEVVHIPEGSQSPSVSSMKRRKEIPIMTRPDIYKNGACPPPLTELHTVINEGGDEKLRKRKRETEGSNEKEKKR